MISIMVDIWFENWNSLGVFVIVCGGTYGINKTAAVAIAIAASTLFRTVREGATAAQKYEEKSLQRQQNQSDSGRHLQAAKHTKNGFFEKINGVFT